MYLLMSLRGRENRRRPEKNPARRPSLLHHDTNVLPQSMLRLPKARFVKGSLTPLALSDPFCMSDQKTNPSRWCQRLSLLLQLGVVEARRSRTSIWGHREGLRFHNMGLS